ncbi:MAG: GNAT family N-acetyltransferase [Caldilineales bacterium]
MLLAPDVPMPTTFHPPPFELYVQREFEDPAFMPQWWLLAMDRGDLIGTSSVFQVGDDMKTVGTGLTGVRRDHRRRGLATVLKCQVIRRLQEQGVQRIVTYNEENNPMFQLNLRLGFQPQPAEIDWQKTPPYD